MLVSNIISLCEWKEMKTLNIKEKTLDIINVITFSLIAVLIVIILPSYNSFLGEQFKQEGMRAEYSNNSITAVYECEETSSKAVDVKVQETLKEYCNSFEAFSQIILDGYADKSGGKQVKVFTIPNDDYSTCSEEAIACAFTGSSEIFIRIKYFSYYDMQQVNFQPLKQVLAHEYIHILTSDEERVWVEDNNALFTNLYDTPSLEVIADCGITYFTEASKITGYLPEGCTDENWLKISKQIIENTLV